MSSLVELEDRQVKILEGLLDKERERLWKLRADNTTDVGRECYQKILEIGEIESQFSARWFNKGVE